jgi:methylglutaconyl-CoA hydratase
MMTDHILVSREGDVAHVTLNRPDSHNALTPDMIVTLRQQFEALGEADDVRVILLRGAGRSFCAGADLEAMRAAADYSFEQNVDDGKAIFDLMRAVALCPKPVVGGVQGAAIGGGAGLASCCDITVAVRGTIFAFSEVRLGIIPAVISPFVITKMKPDAVRELFLTGERFDAVQAQKAGLVQHLVDTPEDLEEAVQARVGLLRQAAPGAQAAVKELLREIAGLPMSELRTYTSNFIAARRASDEGREGMSAFLEKRKPRWQT